MHWHTITTLPYPLNWLPGVSPNNMWHLKLKTLSADLLFSSTNWNFWNLWASNIPLERSWKQISNGVLHAPRKCKIVVEKQKRNIYSRLVTVDQGGQKNCNGKSSDINHQRIELLCWARYGGINIKYNQTLNILFGVVTTQGTCHM